MMNNSKINYVQINNPEIEKMLKSSKELSDSVHLENAKINQYLIDNPADAYDNILTPNLRIHKYQNSIPGEVLDSVGRIETYVNEISELTRKTVDDIYSDIGFDSTEFMLTRKQGCIDLELMDEVEDFALSELQNIYNNHHETAANPNSMMSRAGRYLLPAASIAACAALLLTCGCTGIGNSINKDTLGTVTDHAILDGKFSKEEAKYFENYDFTDLFNDGSPNKDIETGFPIVDKFVFAIGKDGVYFFETTSADAVNGFKYTHPGWMAISPPNTEHNFLQLDFYSGDAYHVIGEDKEGPNQKGNIPPELKFNSEVVVKTNPDGSKNVEGISTDPNLVNEILSMGCKLYITGNAGTYDEKIENLLIEN